MRKFFKCFLFDLSNLFTKKHAFSDVDATVYFDSLNFENTLIAAKDDVLNGEIHNPYQP